MIHEAEQLHRNIPECFREFIEINHNGYPKRQVFKISLAYIEQEYSEQKVDSKGQTIAEIAQTMDVGEMLDTECGFEIIRTK
jgi:hypothetical protein